MAVDSVETGAGTKPESPGADRLVAWLRTALLIRRVEEEVAGMIGVDFFGTTHFCIGQELTAVVLADCLEPGDWLFSNHRNRAHLIARGAEPALLLGELLGKETGYSRGKAGGFHICVPELGIPATSAMVGGNLPVAVGTALGAKLDRSGRIALVFFGDGAINEGAFHETVNLAALWNVPIVFACENNDAVPYNPAASGLAMSDIARWVSGYGLPAESVDGSDVDALHAAAQRAFAYARSDAGPAFLEVRTHKGPLNQLAAPALPCGKLRIADAWSPAEDHPMPVWRDVDPLLGFARELIEGGVIARGEVEGIDAQAQRDAVDAAERARKAPYPSVESAQEHVYADR